jgi:hypothetical protein
MIILEKKIFLKFTILILILVGFTNTCSRAQSKNSTEILSVELHFSDYLYIIEKPDRISVLFGIKVGFEGNYPPKKVYISTLTDTTDPDLGLKEKYDLLEHLGPWKKINNKTWGLEKIIESEELVNSPYFEFNINKDKMWPNEEYKGFIFLQCNNMNINNEMIKSNLSLKVNTPDPKKVFYYMINNKKLKEWEIYDDKKDGSLNKVKLYEWTMTHKYTQAKAFYLLPIAINYIMPINLVAISIFLIIYIIPSKYLPLNVKINLNNLVRPIISILGIILTLIIALKEMLPAWNSEIYSILNFYLIIIFILTTIILILTTVDQTRRCSPVLMGL